ncbi:hypothetical protein [Haloprofundus salinisoli]|uniref:hypothetical protein n=1 Tax=Haloprofundus salinisoli TaxID=2876193 RepID=UPI001CD01E8A|nr:hypothetical protein [Haloprofundus salinisoli]
MNRRTLLARTAALAAVGVAGCTTDGTTDDTGNGGDNSTGNGGTDDTDDETTDDGSTDDGSDGETTELVDQTFERTGDCEHAGSATVTRDGQTAVVEGCIRGRNGCAVAVLDDVQYDAAEDRLAVVVATEIDQDDDEVCSQALVSRGYRVRAEFDGGTPGTVDVVHDGVDGRTTVTTSNTTQ